MLRFSTQNNCCQFLASDGAIIQNVIQSYRDSFEKFRKLSYRILKGKNVFDVFNEAKVIQMYTRPFKLFQRLTIDKILH